MRLAVNVSCLPEGSQETLVGLGVTLGGAPSIVPGVVGSSGDAALAGR